MLAALRGSGGMVRGEELDRLLEKRYAGDIASLARFIVSSKILGFAWRGTFWMPMFQFEKDDLSVKTRPKIILAALYPALSPWACARWFALPNARLHHIAPVDLLESDLAAVLAAACAVREK